MPNVHMFTSTAMAYDASQTNERIKDGDVLVVASEKVVGVLVEAWPVAVTDNTGQFHGLTEGIEWAAIPTTGSCGADYSDSYDLAMAMVTGLDA